MAETSAAFLKDDYEPAQPVRYTWYNDVARLLKTAEFAQETMKLLPGYNRDVTQVLMVKDGAVQWVATEECP